MSCGVKMDRTNNVEEKLKEQFLKCRDLWKFH